MDEVETITDNDQWQLICEFCFLEEILDAFRIVHVAFTTDTLDFFDLAGFTRCLKINNATS